MNNIHFSAEATDLLLVVERLATQDQHRIVRLIDLLSEAPDDLREQTQGMLRALIAREPETHSECLSGMDAIIAHAEHKLEHATVITPKPEFPQLAATYPLTHR
jgi:hypothetical protein